MRRRRRDHHRRLAWQERAHPVDDGHLGAVLGPDPPSDLLELSLGHGDVGLVLEADHPLPVALAADVAAEGDDPSALRTRDRAHHLGEVERAVHHPEASRAARHRRDDSHLGAIRHRISVLGELLVHRQPAARQHPRERGVAGHQGAAQLAHAVPRGFVIGVFGLQAGFYACGYFIGRAMAGDAERLYRDGFCITQIGLP